MKKEIRKFKTGANRDTLEGKLAYTKFLSPIVLKTFAEYMDKHTILANGERREPDNWQHLFGEEHEGVCMESLGRHFMDLWLEHDGYQSREGIEDALCGIMFNAMAYLYKLKK